MCGESKDSCGKEERMEQMHGWIVVVVVARRLLAAVELSTYSTTGFSVWVGALLDSLALCRS